MSTIKQFVYRVLFEKEKNCGEERRYMPEILRKQIDYTVVCVNEFAKKKSIHPRVAFLYLYNHKGIHFLEENYDIEHTLSLEDAIEDLEIICKNNGGKLD